MARALGHKYSTTVQGWRGRGYIPSRQQQAVLNAARAAGITLAPADFFEVEDSPISTLAEAEEQAQGDRNIRPNIYPPDIDTLIAPPFPTPSEEQSR